MARQETPTEPPPPTDKNSQTFLLANSHAYTNPPLRTPSPPTALYTLRFGMMFHSQQRCQIIVFTALHLSFLTQNYLNKAVIINYFNNKNISVYILGLGDSFGDKNW